MDINVRGLDAIIHFSDCHLGPHISTSCDLTFWELEFPAAFAIGDSYRGNVLIKELQREDTFVPMLERKFCDALGNISQEVCLGRPSQNQRFIVGGHDRVSIINAAFGGR